MDVSQPRPTLSNRGPWPATSPGCWEQHEPPGALCLAGVWGLSPLLCSFWRRQAHGEVSPRGPRVSELVPRTPWGCSKGRPELPCWGQVSCSCSGDTSVKLPCLCSGQRWGKPPQLALHPPSLPPALPTCSPLSLGCFKKYCFSLECLFVCLLVRCFCFLLFCLKFPWRD